MLALMRSTMDKIHKSTPLIVEDGGVASRINLRMWKVTMMSGHKGICWCPVEDDKGNPYPCPFVKGKHTSFTYVEEAGKEPKIRPYDMTEFDRQRIISRQAAVNSAAALGADLENWKDHAENIFNWTNQ